MTISKWLDEIIARMKWLDDNHEFNPAIGICCGVHKRYGRVGEKDIMKVLIFKGIEEIAEEHNLELYEENAREITYKYKDVLLTELKEADGSLL